MLTSVGPWAPATATAGFALIAYGIDQAITGSTNIRCGRASLNLSVIESLVYKVTGSETAALLLPAAAAFGISQICCDFTTAPTRLRKVKKSETIRRKSTFTWSAK